MTLWNKIVIGTKFLFGGFESATDYILKLLNKYLSSEKVAGRIQKIREYVELILGFLRKYQDFCPSKWSAEYEKLLATIQTLCDVFSDSQITIEEANQVIANVKAAIDEWFKD